MKAAAIAARDADATTGCSSNRSAEYDRTTPKSRMTRQLPEEMTVAESRARFRRSEEGKRTKRIIGLICIRVCDKISVKR